MTPRVVLKPHACVVDWRKTAPDWAPYAEFKGRSRDEIEAHLVEWLDANVEGAWARGGGADVELFRFERRDERDRFRDHWE